jgi:hypothetical protein
MQLLLVSDVLQQWPYVVHAVVLSEVPLLHNSGIQGSPLLHKNWFQEWDL